MDEDPVFGPPAWRMIRGLVGEVDIIVDEWLTSKARGWKLIHSQTVQEGVDTRS